MEGIENVIGIYLPRRIDLVYRSTSDIKEFYIYMTTLSHIEIHTDVDYLLYSELYYFVHVRYIGFHRDDIFENIADENFVRKEIFPRFYRKKLVGSNKCILKSLPFREQIDKSKDMKKLQTSQNCRNERHLTHFISMFQKKILKETRQAVTISINYNQLEV